MALLHSVSYSGTWGHQTLPLEDFIDKAADLGYDGVMLMAKRPHLSVLDWDGEGRARLRERLAARNLRTICVAGYTNFTADMEHTEVPTHEMQIQHVADLARIEEGLHFCRHFVQRLLDFTRAMPLEKAPQDLATVIESIAGFFQPAILARHATLTVDNSEGRGQLVFADRNLLETLLLTLLSNALDAVPAGGEIRLSCRQSPGTVGFTVRDNGCGISPAHLEHVFEPFFTTKEPGKGTGLGLAIARNVVMEHGGTIEIESRPGEGTTAIVDLPLAEVTENVGRVAP